LIMEGKSAPNKNPKDNLLHIAAGSTSGAVGALIVQPLDVIKTRQQQALFNDIKLKTGLLKDLTSIPKYKGTVDTVRTILKEEGTLGLWKGTSPTMLRVVPGAGLYFFFLHHITDYLRTDQDKALTATSALLAGSVARTTVSITLLPITVVKTRFEGLGTNYYKGTFDALRTIATKEGTRGLFSGLWPTVLRDAPFSGLYYLFYDKIKRRLLEGQSMPDTMVHITAGTVAGIIATVITHPQDVIKTRLQFENASSTRSTMSKVIKEMSKEGGARAFYKGLFPRLIRRPLVAAITWTIYEAMVKQPKRQLA